MGKYRKIDPRIWNDSKFRSLSDAGKLTFFFLLTHPHMTALGAMRSSIPGLAAEIGWTEKAFTKAFSEALSKGMIKHDRKASFVWLPNFLKYNGPESPNVVKAWSKSIDLLPECNLQISVIAEAKRHTESLSEAFSEALPDIFSKNMPYKEQEQEQDKTFPVLVKTKLDESDFYKTKKKKLITGQQLEWFNGFWEAWSSYHSYKKGKADSGDAWLDLKVNKNLYLKIIRGAEIESRLRQSKIDKGSTPKYPQGWLSGRRWEDYDEDTNSSSQENRAYDVTPDLLKDVEELKNE